MTCIPQQLWQLVNPQWFSTVALSCQLLVPTSCLVVPTSWQTLKHVIHPFDVARSLNAKSFYSLFSYLMNNAHVKRYVIGLWLLLPSEENFFHFIKIWFLAGISSYYRLLISTPSYLLPSFSFRKKNWI